MNLDLPLPLYVARELGYAVFTKGELNLNVIGIRTSETQAGSFDDWLTASYNVGGAPFVNWWRGTTDPGAYYLGERKKWLNEAGVAILAPGQYRGAYEIGPHGRSRYEALVQRGPVKVFRDTDLDTELDFAPQSIDEGHFGINIHASSMSPYTDDSDKSNARVGPWSGGCQVFARNHDFVQFMALVKRSMKTYGKRLSYTLITEAQIRDVLGRPA